MEKIYKWGIIGPGRIAKKFAEALKLVPNATLHAVASRDAAKAAEFASTYGAPVSYGSYEALANDKDLDAVYIATPHTFHHAHALLCLQSNIAVLCEKPMSVNYESTTEMVNVARQNNTFLMEAMWSRFLPTINKAAELIAAGEIGTVKHFSADFGFVAPFNPNGRLYDLKLGGGSLLDIGIYPLFFALFIMGKPDEIKSVAHLAPTGADEIMNILLSYKDGKTASILSSLLANTPMIADITGTEGAIVLERPWYKGTRVQVRKNDSITQDISLPYGDNGFEFQIEEVQHCLHNAQTESKLMPLAFSLLMSEIMTDICLLNGINYQIQPS